MYMYVIPGAQSITCNGGAKKNMCLCSSYMYMYMYIVATRTEYRPKAACRVTKILQNIRSAKQSVLIIHVLVHVAHSNTLS